MCNQSQYESQRSVLSANSNTKTKEHTRQAVVDKFKACEMFLHRNPAFEIDGMKTCWSLQKI